MLSLRWMTGVLHYCAGEGKPRNHAGCDFYCGLGMNSSDSRSRSLFMHTKDRVKIPFKEKTKLNHHLVFSLERQLPCFLTLVHTSFPYFASCNKHTTDRFCLFATVQLKSKLNQVVHRRRFCVLAVRDARLPPLTEQQTKSPFRMRYNNKKLRRFSCRTPS